MQNDGTNKLLLKLLLFKGKIIESQLPDEEEVLKGVSIIEQYIRIVNPTDLSESEIDKVVLHVNEAIMNNPFFISFGVERGMEMALNIVKKSKIKTRKMG